MVGLSLKKGVNMNKTRLPHENNHHILYESGEWNSAKASRRLRNDGAFIVPMDKVLHKNLHEELPVGITPLSERALRMVCFELFDKKMISSPDTYPVKAIDKLQIAIEHIPERCLTENDRIMAGWAIYMLDEQIPLIKESVDDRYGLLCDYRRRNRNNTKFVNNSLRR